MLTIGVLTNDFKQKVPSAGIHFRLQKRSGDSVEREMAEAGIESPVLGAPPGENLCLVYL